MGIGIRVKEALSFLFQILCPWKPLPLTPSQERESDYKTIKFMMEEIVDDSWTYYIEPYARCVVICPTCCDSGRYASYDSILRYKDSPIRELQEFIHCRFLVHTCPDVNEEEDEEEVLSPEPEIAVRRIRV